MDSIYLNNFRGFNDAFVELEDVNFFVGENSTGKTSVLKIIKAFCDSDFWLHKNMDLEIANLGYFNEMASDANRSSTSYFELGHYNNEAQNFIKLVYINKKGLPSLSEVFMRNIKLDIQFHVSAKGEIKYRFKKLQNTESKFEMNASNFRKWVKTNETNTEAFHKDEDKLIELPLSFRFFSIIKDVLGDYSSKLLFPPGISSDLYWSAPIRSRPQRIYDNPITSYDPDGSHAPFLLRDVLQNSNDEEGKKVTRKAERIISRFGLDSGLFERVVIKKLTDSITSPFQINIQIGGRSLNYTNVGYGVSQILPLLVEIITRNENSLFAIQQPEVHLHPKGQAAFGDFLFKSNIKEGKKFIVETHSDYLIDRFRIRVHKEYLENNTGSNSQILFFSRKNDGNLVQSIKIENNGKLSENIPDAYREFFIREQFSLLEI